MKTNSLTIIYLLTLNLTILGSLNGQADNKESRFHTGVFFQVYGTNLFFDYELASSTTKPGIALGLYEHYDISEKIQVRAGCAYSWSTLFSKDYSPDFPSDFDPSTGEVDIYKSYITNEVNLGQLFVPIHIRYKFTREPRHFFLAGGLEYRKILSEKFDAKLYESEMTILSFDPQNIYKSRDPNLSTHLEFGYEFPWKSHKLNFSVFSKYGLASQIEGEGSAFYGIYQGHEFDFGISTELIF